MKDGRNASDVCGIDSYFSVTNDDEDDYGTYTLTFNIEFTHDNDTVYFAHSYPYTYSDLQVRWSGGTSGLDDSVNLLFLIRPGLLDGHSEASHQIEILQIEAAVSVTGG